MTRTTTTSSRHGKPRSALERGLDRVMDSPSRRYTFGVLGGMLCTALLVGLVFVLLGGGGGGDGGEKKPSAKKQKAAAAASPTASASPTSSDDLLNADGSDPDVEAFLRDEAPAHLKSVTWGGAFLRIYTDLGEGDMDDPAAKALCTKAVEFLTSVDKDDRPVVFVHAKKNGNGYVVLVNNTNGKCRPVHTR
ncbi:hypothetical protein [Actinocorallia longicatena]|uniref:Uncharacterized protein n=1 Tax=Actinocorallia longicatena TaxID=111803 RepID=A0ABP6QB57_9ACTN